MLSQLEDDVKDTSLKEVVMYLSIDYDLLIMYFSLLANEGVTAVVAPSSGCISYTP